MERLDYYDIVPYGMDAYLSNHGRHFSKPMYEWAVGKMRSRTGKKVNLVERKQLDEMYKTYGVTIQRNDGYYDDMYVYCMAMSDYYGSSIMDEPRLIMYIKDYIDDTDGNPTRAFDEFYANCIAKGIDIPWEDMI